MSILTSLAGRVDAIVIGTSAGGVEALSTLLPALPRDCSVPVLIVIHLPRERPSLLVDIFTARCALPVREAEDLVAEGFRFPDLGGKLRAQILPLSQQPHDHDGCRQNQQRDGGEQP